MVGTLSQLVTLVSYGNAYLRGREIGSLSSNSEFQFCNTVEFLFPKPAGSWFGKELLVGSPLKWLETLKDRKCTRLKLSHFPTPNPEAPDHMLAAFVGGGGQSLIEAAFDSNSDYWAGKWEVTNQKAPDRKIWRVTYNVVAKNSKSTSNAAIDLQGLRNRLEKTLLEIRDFAQKHKVDNFAAIFQNGIDCLNSASVTEKSYHKDLVPDGWYSLEAEQLLTAASNAWVFGGMGSWNDLGFEGADNKIYENLSAKLYSTINESIVAAVNSKH
jgi:hypothetical protein